MLRNIHLHGNLGKRFGKTFEIDVDTAAEAVRALVTQLPGLTEEIRKGEFHLVRGDIDDGMEIDLDTYAKFRLGNADLHIVPAIQGSQKGGAKKAIMGTVLLGLSVIVPGVATIAGPMAVSMITSGVSAMLAGQQKDDDKDSKKNQSYIMNGPGNAYVQGSPIPIVYGEVITGGVLISGGVDIEQRGN